MSSISLSDTKILGGLGALLILFTAVPNVGWLLGIAGLVMVLLAIRNISRAVDDTGIYDNMRNAVILGIGAIAVAGITIAGAIYRLLGMGLLAGFAFPSVLPHKELVSFPRILPLLARSAFPSVLPPGAYFGVALVAIGGLVATWAILLASSVFVRRSLSSMASKLNVGMFKTAGLFYLIGAATAIIGVGFILLFVAEILLAIAFFSMPDQKERLLANQTISPPPTS
jgi:uncharacterized membrane protein